MKALVEIVNDDHREFNYVTDSQYTRRATSVLETIRTMCTRHNDRAVSVTVDGCTWDWSREP
jgi:hypothetical protein